MTKNYTMYSECANELDRILKNERFHSLLKSLDCNDFFKSSPTATYRWDGQCGTTLPLAIYWIHDQGPCFHTNKRFKLNEDGVELPDNIKSEVVVIFNSVFNS